MMMLIIHFFFHPTFLFDITISRLDWMNLDKPVTPLERTAPLIAGNHLLDPYRLQTDLAIPTNSQMITFNTTSNFTHLSYVLSNSPTPTALLTHHCSGNININSSISAVPLMLNSNVSTRPRALHLHLDDDDDDGGNNNLITNRTYPSNKQKLSQGCFDLIFPSNSF